jgi:hypothetical protein
MSSNAENELLEREARARGLSITQYLMLKAAPDSLMRDLMADNWRGISNSASMIPDRERSRPVERRDRLGRSSANQVTAWCRARWRD